MKQSPDERLAGFLDELEQQAVGAWATERELEVVERARAEYARVTLAGRLMASLEGEVELVVTGVGPLPGRLLRVGDGWCLVRAGATSWIVALPAVAVVRGVAARAVAREAWPVTARLGLGSALRGLAGEQCVLRLLDGSRVDGAVSRIGADFVEVRSRDQRPVLVSLGALAAIQR